MLKKIPKTTRDLTSTLGNYSCRWCVIIIVAHHELLSDEKTWLDTEIYSRDGKSDALPQNEITARKRYSFRAEAMEQ